MPDLGSAEWTSCSRYEAEAVLYAPEVPNDGGNRLSALRQAVERLHDEWIR